MSLEFVAVRVQSRVLLRLCCDLEPNSNSGIGSWSAHVSQCDYARFGMGPHIGVATVTRSIRSWECVVAVGGVELSEIGETCRSGIRKTSGSGKTRASVRLTHIFVVGLRPAQEPYRVPD